MLLVTKFQCMHICFLTLHHALCNSRKNTISLLWTRAFPQPALVCQSVSALRLSEIIMSDTVFTLNFLENLEQSARFNPNSCLIDSLLQWKSVNYNGLAEILCFSVWIHFDSYWLWDSLILLACACLKFLGPVEWSGDCPVGGSGNGWS